MIKEEITNFLKKELSEQFGSMAKEGLEIKLDSAKTMMRRTLVVFGLMGLGLLFVLFGLAKYLPTVVKISEGAAFFIIGLTMIVVGLIYRAGAKE